MNLLFIGMTISMLGKVMLATGVILAHSELEHERRVDDEVIRSFHRERIITLLGVLLIVLGYLIEIHYFGGFGSMLTCTDETCAAAVGSLFNQN